MVVAFAMPTEPSAGSHEIFDRPDQVPFLRGVGLGQGGVGSVDEVTGTAGQFQGQTYARKSIILNDAQDREAARREIEKEVDILKRVRHDHIVRLVMTYELRTEYAIIMEPRADGNLEGHLLADTHKAREEISHWFRCLISGVAYLHKNDIQHRDIKPHNILVKGTQVLLTDFGISMTGLGKTIPTTITWRPHARTPEYCAPEVEERRSSGRSADIFSLGAVFLEMLTALSGSDRLRTFRQTLRNPRTDIARRSYAMNMDKASQWMDALGNMQDNPPWHSTILFLCKEMLREDRSRRPKMDDICAWWSHQPPLILPPEGPGSCACYLAWPTTGYSEGEPDENLLWAYTNGHRLMADLWRKRGANISPDEALVAASEGGIWDIVKSLIEQGADVKSIGALQKASAGGFKKTVEVLLDHGAEIGGKDDYGRTALHTAVGGGHKEVVEMLLQKNADVQMKDDNGRTALHGAASRGDKEVVEMLLQKNADVQMKDGNGRAALHDAASRGDKEVVEMLLQKNADVQMKDGNGRTALHDAASRGHKEVVEMLLQKNADVEVMDNNSKRAVELAVVNGHDEVARLLLGI
jgi:serine/threonine protein kinase